MSWRSFGPLEAKQIPTRSEKNRNSRAREMERWQGGGGEAHLPLWAVVMVNHRLEEGGQGASMRYPPVWLLVSQPLCAQLEAHAQPITAPHPPVSSTPPQSLHPTLSDSQANEGTQVARRRPAQNVDLCPRSYVPGLSMAPHWNNAALPLPSSQSVPVPGFCLVPTCP